MKPPPRLVIPPPVVEFLPDGRYLASSPSFPDLWTVGWSADTSLFVLRLLIQKRLYGQHWAWGTASPRMSAATAA